MIIGITGGIGTGKSTVLNILNHQYGYIVFEADKIAHELMQKGNASYNKIVDYFGKGILGVDGEIDRKKLGSIVFSDKVKLEKLNEFTHLGVIDEISKRISLHRNKGKDRFVIEAALLFESGCNRICDKVWYIYTDKDIRILRLKNSRNMTEEQIKSVMKNQLDRENFEKMSDAVIDNSDSVENTEKQIQNLLEF